MGKMELHNVNADEGCVGVPLKVVTWPPLKVQEPSTRARTNRGNFDAVSAVPSLGPNPNPSQFGFMGPTVPMQPGIQRGVSTGAAISAAASAVGQQKCFNFMS